MTYTIKPELPSEIAKKVTISYKTSNKKIAEVNQSGKVTAVGKGTVKIRTTVKLSNGSSKTFTTIIMVQKAGVGFSQKKSTARVGENITFEAYVHGYSVEDIYWMTSKRDIAVTGKNYGKLKVTLKAKTAGTDTVILYVPGANGKYLTVKAKIVIKK